MELLSCCSQLDYLLACAVSPLSLQYAIPGTSANAAPRYADEMYVPQHGAQTICGFVREDVRAAPLRLVCAMSATVPNHSLEPRHNGSKAGKKSWGRAVSRKDVKCCSARDLGPLHCSMNYHRFDTAARHLDIFINQNEGAHVHSLVDTFPYGHRLCIGRTFRGWPSPFLPIPRW